ncbi:C5a anaphylatoxin chemotactic receptor 1-like [Haliotis asinina]|uniref:C5a anaphylatoxin chemotactic receptor 1-like n=1 Tax=Haliotis asinina TaxID=109174 RepID=UPI003532584F
MKQDDNSTRYLQQYDDMYVLKYYPAIAFVAVCMLVGVVGNLLVCYVYLCKFKPSTTRCFIVTLAVLDILNCSLSMSLKIVHMRYHATFGLSNLCRLSTITVTLFSLASAGILVPVAVDRYLKICKPFVRQMTIFHAKVSCWAACTGALVLTIPPAIIHGPTHHPLPEVNATFCYLTDGEGGTLPHVIYSTVQTLLFVWTAGTLFIMYTCIWCRLYKQKRALLQRTIACTLNSSKDNSTGRYPRSTDGTVAISSNVNGTTMNETSSISQPDKHSYDPEKDPCRLNGERAQRVPTSSSGSGVPIGCVNGTMTSYQQNAVKKMTLMLFLISLIFFLSFLPYLIITVYLSINMSFAERVTVIPSTCVIIFERSYFIQSAFNPFIYSFCSVNFRRKLKKICR